MNALLTGDVRWTAVTAAAAGDDFLSLMASPSPGSRVGPACVKELSMEAGRTGGSPPAEGLLAPPPARAPPRCCCCWPSATGCNAESDATVLPLTVAEPFSTAGACRRLCEDAHSIVSAKGFRPCQSEECS